MNPDKLLPSRGFDLECGDRSPHCHDATCRVGPKRGHVRALQNHAQFV